MKKMALFDFDGTLIKSDSFITFSIFAIGKARFMFCVLRALPWIVCWKLGLKSGGWAKERLFNILFSGMRYDEWQRRCENFVSVIKKDIREEMVKQLHQHQNEGHSVVIVTASPVDWVRPWAIDMGIDDVIGTEIEINSSMRLSGRFSTPNCHGREKIRRVMSAYPHVGECETWAYGDSSSDKYLLSIATHPYMVGKDDIRDITPCSV